AAKLWDYFGPRNSHISGVTCPPGPTLWAGCRPSTIITSSAVSPFSIANTDLTGSGFARGGKPPGSTGGGFGLFITQAGGALSIAGAARYTSGPIATDRFSTLLSGPTTYT